MDTRGLTLLGRAAASMTQNKCLRKAGKLGFLVYQMQCNRDSSGGDLARVLESAISPWMRKQGNLRV